MRIFCNAFLGVLSFLLLISQYFYNIAIKTEPSLSPAEISFISSFSSSAYPTPLLEDISTGILLKLLHLFSNSVSFVNMVTSCKHFCIC